VRSPVARQEMCHAMVEPTPPTRGGPVKANMPPLREVSASNARPAGTADGDPLEKPMRRGSGNGWRRGDYWRSRVSNPRSGCHDSITRFFAPASRCVYTTSVTSTRIQVAGGAPSKLRSTASPWPAILASPSQPASLPGGASTLGLCMAMRESRARSRAFIDPGIMPSHKSPS